MKLVDKMYWKIFFLLTAALTVLTSSQFYTDGYLRNVSYNIPNIFQRREREQRLLRSHLTIPSPIENDVKSHEKDDFYKQGRSYENNEFIPNVTTEYCKEQVLIEKVINYPTDYVNQLIDEKMASIFNPSPEHLGGISQNNIRGLSLTLRLCKINERVSVPFAAYVADDDECYFVLNRKAIPVQVVRFESCASEGGQCEKNGILTLYEQIQRHRNEYTTSCNQTYIWRSLMVLDHYGMLMQKPVTVKATCVCTKALKP